jgi:hypothetical protein
MGFIAIQIFATFVLLLGNLFVVVRNRLVRSK